MSTQEVGVRLKLETGEAVANANQATQAVDSLVNALQKAAIAGNSSGVLDYARALTAYNKATGIEEERNDKGQQQSVLRVVENATKVISRAPGYIGAIGSGNAAGAALGMASDVAAGAKAGGLFAGLGTGATVGLGVGAALVGVGLAANKLSEQWEKQVPQAMELTAVLGNLTGNYRTNSEAFRKAFNLAGESAAKFGYSLEEGMSVVEQLAKIGVSSNGLTPYNAAQQVFRFERGTGADRESLMRAEGYAARYGAGPNALGYTYGGTMAQGLASAQYQEYLNATLSIFEEGLNRGIIKGFDEITRTQNFIALLGNGNPAWKGEQGLQRYQTMNEGFKSTSFESEYDVVRYKAVENTLREAARRGFKDDAEGKWSVYERYGNINENGYLAVQRAREQGLTPEIFTETMKILQTQIAGGSYANLTEAVVKAFGVNYTAAKEIIDSFNSGAYKHATAVIAEPTSAASPEMTLKTATEEIKLELANAGANVLPTKTEVMSVLRGILMGITGNKVAEGYQKAISTALGGIYGSKSEEMVKGKAESLLTKGLNDKTGKDTDQNGISDNSEAAMNIISYLENLPDDVRRYLSASGTLDSLWTGKNVNDLPGIADFLAKNQYKTKDWEKGFNAFTDKTPPSLNEISSLFDKFGQYNPKWMSEYPKIGIFKGAAVDNDPGAGGLFREISLRIKTLESSWDEKIAKATKDAKADGSVTKKEQSYIDQLEAGKKKELSALIDSILGPLNTLIDSAGRNGGGITQDEWEKMWKMIAPGVQSGAPPVSQSNYEPSGVGPAEAAMAKLPVSLSLAGSSFADMLTGKFRGWAPRMETAALTPSFDSAGFVQPTGNGENNGEQATTLDKPQIDYRGFSALFMSAQQKSLSSNEVAQSSVDWHDFFLSFARILNDFTVNNNAAAEKIAKAADKIAEPTEVIIGSGNAFERA